MVATINVHHRTRRLVSRRQAASASRPVQRGEGGSGARAPDWEPRKSPWELTSSVGEVVMLG